MKIRKRFQTYALLSPTVVVMVPILVQWLCWMYGVTIGFSNHIIIPPIESSAHYTFAAYIGAVIIGALIGHFLPLNVNIDIRVPRLDCLRRVIGVQFVLLVISAALYARGGLNVMSVMEGVNIADISTAARAETIPGITSFTFIGLTLIPLGAYYVVRYQVDMFISAVMCIAIAVLLMLAFFFAGRIFIVYPIVAALFVAMRLRVPGESTLSIFRAIAIYGVAIGCVFGVFSSMEYFRSWQVTSRELDIGYLEYVTELFFAGYLAQNHDNAITFLSNPPAYTWLASAPALVRVVEFFGSDEIRSVATVRVDFGEGHNTVVIFGALYQDLGFALSLMTIVIVMALAQRLFRVAASSNDIVAILLYAVFVPHLMSMCRINGFGTVSFPVALIGWAMIRYCRPTPASESRFYNPTGEARN